MPVVGREGSQWFSFLARAAVVVENERRSAWNAHDRQGGQGGCGRRIEQG